MKKALQKLYYQVAHQRYVPYQMKYFVLIKCIIYSTNQTIKTVTAFYNYIALLGHYEAR